MNNTSRLRQGEEYHDLEVLELAEEVVSFSEDYVEGFEWRTDEDARERLLTMPIENTFAPNNSGQHYWFDMTEFYQSATDGDYDEVLNQVLTDDDPVSRRAKNLQDLGRDVDTIEYARSALGEN